VKLLTDDLSLPYAVKIDKIKGIDGYSNFVTRKLGAYVGTSHCLLVQADGYVLNGKAWSPEFLNHDFVGCPWNAGAFVGNGGFSLRSRRLLDATAVFHPDEFTHPEDYWICFKHRDELANAFGIRFAPMGLARSFGYEGRYVENGFWRGLSTMWDGQFGFHSWLTPLPDRLDRPLVFHHSGDAGDVVYSLPVIKAYGGGVLVLSADNHHPWPTPTRWQLSGGDIGWVENLAPLMEVQDYIWKTIYAQKMPPAVDVDLNVFREYYRGNSRDFLKPLVELHKKAFGLPFDDEERWLRVDYPVTVPGRDLCVSRTGRYHCDVPFPWGELVKKYQHRMFFLGTEDEFGRFQAEYGAGTVVHVRTANLLEVARYIAGARVFLGNQSSPLAIAHGLGQNSVIETWLQNPNCMLERQNVVHWRGGHCDIPPHWL
jgi:hypothetical protein